MKTTDVLIIDDDEICCLILKERLQSLGLSVQYELKSENYIASLEDSEKRIDSKILILDIYMPEKDGFEIIYALKKQESMPYIIAISSDDTFFEIIQFLGVQESYPKNNIDLIINAVDTFFKISKH